MPLFNHFNRVMLASAMLGVAALGSHAQQSHARRSDPHLTARSFQRLILNWKWTQRNWTGDEASYRATNAQVRAANLDAKVQAGQDPAKLLAPYKQAVVENAGSPLTAYKWVLATFYATKHAKPQVASILWNNTFPLLHHYQEPQLYSADEPWFTMANTGKLPKAPLSYWFDRLMFIAAVENGVYQLNNSAGVERLSALADRLTKRNPKDRDVQLRQIKMLQNAGNSLPPSKWSEKALELARQYTSQAPTDADRYLTLANAYIAAWNGWSSSSKSYGDKAINAYQKYLALSPKSSKWRGFAQKQIKSVQESKAIFVKYKSREEWLASLSRK